MGSNIGRRLNHIERAIHSLARVSQLIERSSIYISMPVGYDSKHSFLNMVVCIQTDLSAQELLTETQMIEKKEGRRTSKKGYEDRTLDIDILFFNDEAIENGDLKIPHPEIEKRAFVIAPLMEVCPNLVHPISGISIAELYLNCEGLKDLRPYHP